MFLGHTLAIAMPLLGSQLGTNKTVKEKAGEMSLSHGDWPHPWPLNDTKSEINYSDAGHKAPQHKSSLSSTYQCLQYFKLTCYQCLRLEIWDRRRISTQQWKVHRYSE